MMLLKCCSQYVSKFGNSAMAPGLENVSFDSKSQRSTMPKNVQTTDSTILLISNANKVMLKILQVSISSTSTKNFQMYKVDLEKAEEPEIKLPTSTGS